MTRPWRRGRPIDRVALLVGCGLLAALWVVAPWLAAYLNEPPVRSERRLSPRLRSAALRYALLHWSFFERFVTERTHWLAPDNFQESPTPVVAMRTSPTNIGLQLLATVSAHDLGFIDLEETTTRLERVFDTLAKLRRFRGHFYNWYDLNTLDDLAPGYISTVDSGNLAGHLIALRQACLAAPDAPVFDRRTWAAVDAALGLWQESLPKTRLPAELAAARALLAAAPEQLDVAETLRKLEDLLEGAARATPSGTATTDWLGWTLRLVGAARHRVEGLQPLAAAGRNGTLAPRMPSLRQLAERSEPVGALLLRLQRIAERCDVLVEEMDFSFLYDKQRSLFAIGYQLTTHALDSSHYDLLASEARLASFVAIAKNDVPVEHWFHLGRELSRAAGETALMSWSGTMFEYLMPALVMRSFPFTLLDQTYRGSVQRQIAFAGWRSCPLGHQRERLQPARPRPDLPVPELRGAGPGVEARPRRRPGGGSLRLAPGGDGGAGAGPGQPPPARAPGGARTLRLPRRAGLHSADARGAPMRWWRHTWPTTSGWDWWR